MKNGARKKNAIEDSGTRKPRCRRKWRGFSKRIFRRKRMTTRSRPSAAALTQRKSRSRKPAPGASRRMTRTRLCFPNACSPALRLARPSRRSFSESRAVTRACFHRRPLWSRRFSTHTTGRSLGAAIRPPRSSQTVLAYRQTPIRMRTSFRNTRRLALTSPWRKRKTRPQSKPFRICRARRPFCSLNATRLISRTARCTGRKEATLHFPARPQTLLSCSSTRAETIWWIPRRRATALPPSLR